MTDNQAFYDQLSPFYHLIYEDWSASVDRQAAALDVVIRETWGGVHTILDAACGIGTQALGLAARGYAVTGADLSPTAVARAREEAAARELVMPFHVADMRRLADHFAAPFDLVLAADNAVPHLLTDDEILVAFQNFYHCTRPGGGCLITVRDYDAEPNAGTHVKPYGLRDLADGRALVFQVWDFDGPHYDVAAYFVFDRGDEVTTQVMCGRYYAVGTDRLLELLAAAGFADPARLDGRFFQPILLAHRPAAPRRP